MRYFYFMLASQLLQKICTTLLLVFCLVVLTHGQKEAISVSKLPLADSLIRKSSDSTVFVAPFGNDSTKKDTTQTKQATLTQTDSVPKVNKDSLDYYANSVWIVYQSDLYLNTNIERNPDTLVHKLHRYGIIQKNEYIYQDLGNLGTAAQPIFYQMPSQIGTRWGVSVYEPYIRRPDEVPYLNSLAPYVDVYLVQGGQGKSWLDVTVSRNVNPDWNVSIFYRRLSANFVTNKAFRRNDEMLEHQTFSVVNRFYSRNHRYKLLANFSWYDHGISETGGVESSISLDGLTLQQQIDTLVRLDNSELKFRLPAYGKVKQYGRTFHLYQQYSLAKGGKFEIFHELDYSTNATRYLDDNTGLSQNAAYYSAIYPLPVVSANGFFYKNAFASLENRGGIKGRIGGFQYRTFAKLRTYEVEFDYPFAEGERQIIQRIDVSPETFVGGGLRYFFDSLSFVDISTEYQLLGDYQVSAEWTNNNLKIGAKRMNYSPSIAERYSFQPHLRWVNEDFERTVADRIYASFAYSPISYLNLRPYVELSNIQKLVYIDSLAIAKQTSKATQSLSAGIEMRAKYKQWNALLQLRYNQNTGEDLLRMPTFFGNMMFYYKDNLFDDAMMAEIGTDIHFHTRYLADAYNPLIQQFHLQNHYQVGGFPQMDIFFNFKVSKARICFKMNNLLLDVAGKGYYDTPFYIAQPRSFEVVVNWLFFN